MHNTNYLHLPPIYPILDATTLAHRAISPDLAAEAILEAGAKILQFRHKDPWTRDTYAQATRLANLCLQNEAIFVVNDRADYAKLLNAALHVGQDDPTPTDARKVIGPDPLLGFSTHNPTQMEAARLEPVDYVAFGPIFTTASKLVVGNARPDPTTGPDALRHIRTLTTLPLVAIGGITRDNAKTCWNAGADSVAVIADLLPLSCSKQEIRNRMAEWLQLTNL